MNEWMNQWFDSAAQTNNGGIVRRSIDTVQNLGDISAGIAEARNRGWHIIETGDQYVLLCHQGELTILV